MKAIFVHVVPYLVISLWFLTGSGCGKLRRPQSDADLARGTLRLALDAWKKGDPVSSLQDRSPPIQVTDFEWKGSFALLDYQVTPKDQLFAGDLRCQVKLSLRSPKGKTLEKQATYSVGTTNGLRIIREDDD